MTTNNNKDQFQNNAHLEARANIDTIKIAFVDDKFASVSRVSNIAWHELAALLLDVKVGEKDGPGWLPADIEPGPRKGERVNATTLLVLDVEADTIKDQATGIKTVVGPEPPDPDAMLAELEIFALMCILHTSYSHHDPSILPIDQIHPRYRLVFPLSRSLVKDEIKVLGLHIAGLLGIADCLDKNCLEPARLYYLPRCPAERRADFRHGEVDGVRLDVDGLLSAAQRESDALSKPPKKIPEQGAGGGVIDAFNQAHDIGAILELHGYIVKGRNRWLHPNSTTGMPGVRRMPNSMPERVFSSHSSDPLNDGHAHDAFDCFRILKHGGDVRAAIRDASHILRLQCTQQGNYLMDNSWLTADAYQQISSQRFSAPVITHEEMLNAKASPDLIVERLYYADVGTMIAPGGVGKTTLMINIAANLVLGRDVLGETVHKPGPVLIVSAEDSREILVARLSFVMASMSLTESERAIVMRDVRIADVSGVGFKLTEIIGDVVTTSNGLDVVIEVARNFKPVLIVIDPAVSFGVGEQRVNDAEQGLIEAARRLRNELRCGVIYIHHSGKANAREKSIDQYAGRGGSAFADGSRMVHVLQHLTPEEWHKATGQELADGETGMIFARPKMSYCQPPGEMYIKRRDYQFERVEPAQKSKAAQAEAHAIDLWKWLSNELTQGRYHSRNTIEEVGVALMNRAEIRLAISWLEASGRLESRKRPEAGQRGARQFLYPVGSPGNFGEPMPETIANDLFTSPSNNTLLASPPYRNVNGGEPSRAV